MERTGLENTAHMTVFAINRICAFMQTLHIQRPEPVRVPTERRTFISMATEELPRIPTFHGSIKKTLNKKDNSTSTVTLAIIFSQKIYL